MNTEHREPTDTIRAELARRRMTVGRLAATTGIKEQTLHRRLADPDKFRLPELAAIAIALEIDPGTFFELWMSRNGAAK